MADHKVPNIDRLTVDGLLIFAQRHENGRNYKLLFPDIFPNVLGVTANLANYAAALAGYRILREVNDPPQLLVYEWLKNEYFTKIPVPYRWRRV